MMSLFLLCSYSVFLIDLGINFLFLFHYQRLIRLNENIQYNRVLIIDFWGLLSTGFAVYALYV